MNYTRYMPILAIVLSIFSISYTYESQKQNYQLALGSTVLSTASSDTLETFRTNVNSSLSSLQNDKVSTTSANTWTAFQTLAAGATTTLLSANFAQFGATATTTLNANGTLGIGSSTPLGKLGIGTTGATSTISGGYFCAYFKDEAGRGMWIKLATSGGLVFATSTTPCQ